MEWLDMSLLQDQAEGKTPEFEGQNEIQSDEQIGLDLDLYPRVSNLQNEKK
jgi:hypothetical protein